MQMMDYSLTNSERASLSPCASSQAAAMQSRLRRVWLRGGMALLAILLIGLPALAQSTSADLSGTITDPTGALLPGSTVVAASSDQTVRSTQVSDGKGYFSITNLQPGNYVLTVSHVGFKTQVIHRITLNANDTRSIAVKLQIGSAGEYVNVTGESTLVNTSGAVSNTIDKQLIDDLPLDGRSIQTLITLSPGVQAVPVDPSGGNPGQFSVNGIRSDMNYFTVDGVSANFAASAPGGNGSIDAATAGGTPATDVNGSFFNLASIDDLQEFQIQTSSFAPEFGRNPGAQVSLVTRSGGNKFHGSLFEYFRNDALDAADWFSDYFQSGKQALRYNDFGGTFGGPIMLPKYDGKKKSTYFFFSYEANRFLLPQPATQGIVPSKASRQAAPNATASSILDAFPLPNGSVIYADADGNACEPGSDPTCIATGGQFINAGWSNPSHSNVASLRFDQSFRDKYTFFVRYNRARSFSSSKSLSDYANDDISGTNTNTLTIGTTQTITSKLVNQFTINGSSQTIYSGESQDTFLGSVPMDESLLIPSGCSSSCGGTVAIDGLSTGSTGTLYTQNYFGGNSSSKNRQINGVDNVSWETRGHQLKFGADYRYLSPVIDAPAYLGGVYYDGVQSVYNNTTEFGLVSYSQGYALAIKSFSAYAQDSWKITPRLVLTYGTRWELDPAPSGKNGKSPLTVTSLNLDTIDFNYLTLAPLGTPIYKTSHTAFAPRFGFSYVVMPSSKFNTVLRGGGGIFYDTGQGGIGAISFPYDQFYFLYGAANSVGTYPAFGLPVAAAYANEPAVSFTPSLSNQASVSVTVPGYKLPRVYQWNLTLQQSIGPESVASLAYVASSGHALQHHEQYIFNEGDGLPFSNNFSELSVIDNSGASNYNSLQAQVQSHIAKKLEVQLAYTWSHSIDNGSSDTTPNSTDPRADRGPSDFDTRNSVSAAFTYNLPSYGGAKIVKSLLNNWSLNSIFGAHSSPPFNIYSEDYVAGALGLNYTERADTVPGQPVWIHAKDSSAGFPIPGGKYVNPNAFSDPSSTALQGDSGRNYLRGFGFWQLDFGVHRAFPITDSVKVQFRAEAFNIFNHPNFSNPTTTQNGDFVGTAAPGADGLGNTLGFGETASSLASGLGGGSNVGGFNPLFQVGGPRAVQLALRIEF